ncbi:MAG: hypothetical protein HOH22_05685 [Rhodospirillaceae bacterium]|nr:hypothetical protein [Rhodospirillaceae bacterium]
MSDPLLELWPNSGYRLLHADENGWLAITDDFLRAYWMRPEVAPIDESCDAERTLHARLMEAPRTEVTDADINAFEDPDAQENYRVVLSFRDRLISAGTVEAAYLSLFREGGINVPPLFVDQLAQAVARHVVGQSRDPFRARAAELLFREQQATLHEGAILLGDKEVVDMLGASGGFGNLGKLLVEGGVQAREVEMDVLLADTAAEMYWPRNEKFDTVLDVTFSRPGLDALCRVLETWVKHFLEAEVSIQPVQQISDERWVWHVGLDAEATALLNDLYEAKEVEEECLERLLSLFRLEFKDPSLMRADVAGRAVYLALCMTEDKRVRLKPQNLLVNLPLAQEA